MPEKKFKGKKLGKVYFKEINFICRSGLDIDPQSGLFCTVHLNLRQVAKSP